MKKRTLSLLASSLLLASLSIHAAIPKGDGLIINDVADMMDANGSGSVVPVDALKGFLTAKSIKYIFPDFINIQNQNLANNLALLHCQGNGKSSIKNATLVYVSYNQLKASDDLGPECIDGQAVTKTLYSPGRMVLPMIDGSAYAINGTSNTKQIEQLATLIATTINADPNAAGVSFDLEGPSLDSSVNAQTFITTLAKALKPQTNGSNLPRYVAIFDGETVMNTLQKLGKLPSNVILLHALYDEGVCNAKHPNDPCSPSDYAAHPLMAPSYSYPVMYVVPAAATTRLYEKKIMLNLSAGESKKPLPAPDNLTQQPCATLLDPNGTAFNSAIAQSFLTLPKGKNGNAFDNFISAADCHLYINQGVSQQQYLAAALKKVDYAYASKDASSVVGVTLYNVKPSLSTQPTRQFNAVTGAKGYYNIYTTTDPSDPTHFYYGYYPESITPAVWQAYQTWRQNHPIKQ